ncbi:MULTISPECIES: TetR/AcrR family transcriptional regulator [unclassified Streptomyces]|uniref:TetR/AcrR family transcriptional regulator n=1 Tax=unclassified Streptomyces TaxID=2593676 RepID=UPI0008DC9C56|nr:MULTISPECIES: TetR/AcrR family transcriptional regulator [unclassified Streptomyces]OII69567.1 TetR family transcriptional regulator [Streptomyces sp. CC77]
MRSMRAGSSQEPEDRTTRARIRDEALKLFTEKGPDRVPVRQIAAAAGVSPGLVVHHFGSKEGLREEVDRHVVAVFERMLKEVADGGPVGSLAQAVAAGLPGDSPVPGYLSRMLTTDGDAGQDLFRRLLDLSRRTLAEMAREGTAATGRDPDVRAAFLLVNDLAVFLLRRRIEEALGVDPLSPPGLERWGHEVLAVYGGGLRAADPADGEEEAR